VYTVLVGNYEELNDVDYPTREGTRKVVFTDSDDLESPHWDVIKIEKRFPNDSIRSSRHMKIMGPALLPHVKESLYIDNSVHLKAPPDEIMDDWLANADFGLARHSFRPNVLAEFGAILDKGLDDSFRVYEQLFHYQEECPAALEADCLWGAILARRHTELVSLTMTKWWEQVLRYSRRDQLSLPYAIASTGIKISRQDISNRRSKYHRWPADIKRKPYKKKQNPLVKAISEQPLVRLAELEHAHYELKNGK
jgi:hypothetical protein